MMKDIDKKLTQPLKSYVKYKEKYIGDDDWNFCKEFKTNKNKKEY